LADLLAWWREAHVRGIVIGGLAVALLGRPRTTRDVDAVVMLDEARWPEFLAAGAAHGFGPRVADALAFAREARVLLVHHQASGIDADISLGQLPFEEQALDRAQTVDVGGLAVPIPTPEDLIIMKAVAHRDRDLADIEGILAAHAKLDVRRIRRWVRDFAGVLEMPELLEDLEALLAKRPQRKRRKGKS
jgi:hypothetical protein